MPDITMCTNTKCLLAPICYRSTATPNEQQSYAHFEPTIKQKVNTLDLDCKMFMSTPKKPTYNTIAAKMQKDKSTVFSYFRGEITKEEFDKSGIELDAGNK